MRGRSFLLATVASAFCVQALSCTSNHHVSPFPDEGLLAAALSASGNLDRQLARIDEEGQRAGFVLTSERRGKLADGSVFVVRGYRATDALGRPAFATRVATPQAIVLALGPLDASDVRPKPTELVEHLVEGGFWSGTDLNGDGAPDVVVKDALGALQVWRIDPMGAAPYPVKLLWPPDRALDIDGDGRPDLASAPPPFEGDTIAPILLDAATFDENGYEDTSAAARIWHAVERRHAEEHAEHALAEKRATDFCRAALERALHAVLSGEKTSDAFAWADTRVAKLSLPDKDAQSWIRWRGLLAERLAR